MGNTNSAVDEYTNDFELVIRCSKFLETCIVRNLRPAERSDGLMDKIRCLESHPQCPSDHIMEKMRQLVRWRNLLVHDINCNSLIDCGTNRCTFRRDYEQVKEALRDLERPVLLDQYHSGVLSRSTRPSANEASTSSPGLAELGLFGMLAVGAVAVAASLGDDRDDEDNERRR